MESVKCQMAAGPMPPKVVMTHGRKRRPRAAEPEACLAGVCLRTRTQTGQARAPRALWSAPYRLQPPQRHTHIPRAHGITVVTLLIVFVIPRGVTEVRRSRRMGNGAAKSVQFSQSPMTVLHDIVTGPDPKELVKKWKAAMRGESRKIDRNIRGPVWRVNPLHTRKST